MHDGRDVAHEAVVGSDAKPLALWQLSPPAGLPSDGLYDTPQPTGVHRVPLGRFAMIPAIAQRFRAHLAGWADHLEQEVLGITAGGRGELGDERLDRKRVGNVRHRAEPADPRVSGRLGVLDTDVGDGERHVDDAHAELEGSLVLRRGIERRDDRRRYAAMQPRDRLALRI